MLQEYGNIIIKNVLSSIIVKISIVIFYMKNYLFLSVTDYIIA
nr:MAG TPA: hypothetical protein [Caudoviricetes sp.]